MQLARTILFLYAISYSTPLCNKFFTALAGNFCANSIISYCITFATFIVLIISRGGFEPKRKAKKSLFFKAFSGYSPILHQLFSYHKILFKTKPKKAKSAFLGSFCFSLNIKQELHSNRDKDCLRYRTHLRRLSFPRPYRLVLSFCCILCEFHSIPTLDTSLYQQQARHYTPSKFFFYFIHFFSILRIK